ncbi:MAG: hypothetical protein K2P85_03510 [Flavobacteriaceae bacterium]|nr:hypothetical protein [Flavobacteriaceae bacterium]
MAKQEGLIRLRGTIDGVNFYFRKGKPIARMAGGGFNGASIKNSATMVRVRENNTEFGHCSKVKKVFSDVLLFHFANRKDVTLHSRLMRLFIAIKDCDLISERGKRTVNLGLQTAAGQHLLTSFEFTAMPFPDLPMDVASTTLELSLPSFSLSEFKFPLGATHLELFLGVLHLNLDTKTATLNKSASVLLAKGVAVDSFTLTPNVLPNTGGYHLPVLFYSYVQEVNGEVYPLNDSKSFGLRVLDVLV